MNCGNMLRKRIPTSKKIPQKSLSVIRKKRYGFLLFVSVILIFLLLPPFLNTFLQYLIGINKPQWYKSYGGNEDDGALSLIQTSDGGYALTGYTQSFGAGRSDIWLIKTDPNGVAQWNQTYGGTGRDIAYSFIQTSDKGFALAGYTNSSGAGSADIWLVKTDKNGIMQWNQTYGGPEWDACVSLLQTSDGGYALAGATNSTGAGSADMWLVKTDKNGITQWNYTYGGTEIDGANVLLRTIDGGFALVGSTNSSGSGEHDIWLVKTDENGVSQWNRTYIGDGLYGVSALQTEDGEYILLCHNRSESSFIDFYGLMLIKTNINGVLQWSRTFEGLVSLPLQFGYFKPLFQTQDRGFALAGLTFSGDSFGTLIVKTDLNGDILWTKSYKEMKLVREEEGELCMVSSLLQIPSGDYIMAGVVFIFAADASEIIDTDFWVGLVIQNIDQISGWEFSPFLIALCVLNKKFKKRNLSRKNKMSWERRN